MRRFRETINFALIAALGLTLTGCFHLMMTGVSALEGSRLDGATLRLVGVESTGCCWVTEHAVEKLPITLTIPISTIAQRSELRSVNNGGAGKIELVAAEGFWLGRHTTINLTLQNCTEALIILPLEQAIFNATEAYRYKPSGYGTNIGYDMRPWVISYETPLASAKIGRDYWKPDTEFDEELKYDLQPGEEIHIRITVYSRGFNECRLTLLGIHVDDHFGVTFVFEPQEVGLPGQL